MKLTKKNYEKELNRADSIDHHYGTYLRRAFLSEFDDGFHEWKIEQEKINNEEDEYFAGCGVDNPYKKD